tara:strand:+ start:1563 stop:1817 length:255 start_codon:yes stop_codon:yes gene_type:complete
MAYGSGEMGELIRSVWGMVLLTLSVGACWVLLMFSGPSSESVTPPEDLPVEAVPAFCTVQDIISMQEVINECHERLRMQESLCE